MLRSSREGRKQAARFHAFPALSNASHTQQFVQQKQPRRSHAILVHEVPRMTSKQGGAGMQPAKQQQQPRKERQAARLSESAHAIGPSASGSKGPPQHESRVDFGEAQSSRTGQSYDEDWEVSDALSGPEWLAGSRHVHQALPADDINSSSSSSSSSISGDRSVQIEPSMTSVLLPLDMLQEKTPSRGTTEDHSQTSSLSSPPTSHLEDAEEVASLQSWTAKMADPDLMSRAISISSDDDEMSEDDRNGASSREASRPQRHYKRFEPRSVEGASLIDDRARRVKLKSKKMIEAEETMALTPTRRKRTRMASTASSSSSSTLTRTSILGIAEEGRTPFVHQSQKSVGMPSITGAHVGSPALLNESNAAAASPMVLPPVKRKRGRPLGSTKQKIREAAERALTASMEQSANSLPSSSKEVVEPQYKTTISASTDLFDHSSVGTGSSTDSVLQRRPRRSADDQIVTGKVLSQVQETQNASSITRPAIGVTTQGESSSAGQVLHTERMGKTQKPLSKRKVFLTSGLYSNDYKKETVGARAGRRSVREVREALVQGTSRSRKASSLSALPLPTDFGAYLLEEKRDFRLPFSIAEQVEELRNKMEAKAKRKPPTYAHISRNRYFSRSQLPGEILICQCPADGDCGESCVNRQTEYLCNPKHCPCGERCTNIYFGKRKAVKTEVQWYGARGFGLKTLEPIARGAFIDEYRGEVIDYNEAVRRIRDHYKALGNYYFLMYDAPAGEMLDGGLKGNITRFANHSCDPNCKVEKWLICGTDEQRSGEFQVALFAERDIAAGEELTYDYGWSAFAAKAVSEGKQAASAVPEACHCGAINCSGFMGVKKQSASATAAAGSSKATAAARALKKLRQKKRTRKVRAKTGRESAPLRSRDLPQMLAPHSPNVPVTPSSGGGPVTPQGSGATLSAPGVRRGLLDQVAKNCESASTLSPLSTIPGKGTPAQSNRQYLKTTASSRSAPGVTIHRESPIGRLLEKRGREKEEVQHLQGMSASLAQHSDEREGSSNVLTNLNGDKDLAKRDDETATDDSAGPKKRLKVSDRVISVWIPVAEALKEEERRKKSLIVEGKRDRRLSLKASEQARSPDADQGRHTTGVGRTRPGWRREMSSAPRRNRYTFPAAPVGRAHDREGSRSLANDDRVIYKGVVKDPYHGLRNASGTRFRIGDYPANTSFVDRYGLPFDFAQYRQVAMHKRGSKPMLFTPAEQREYVRQTLRSTARADGLSMSTSADGRLGIMG